MTVYLYGITSSSHPLRLDGLSGIDGEVPRAVTEGGLTAVTGRAPEDLRAKRRHLMAHQNVLTALAEQGTVLPMRFGLVLADQDAVRAELAGARDTYTGLLAELDGRVEVNVKVSHEEDAVLRQILTEDPQLREQNEALRAAGGGSYDDRLRFGELVAAAVEAALTRDGNHVLASLRPLAERESVEQLGRGTVLNASFLMERGAVERFGAAAERLDEDFGERLTVRWHGPLPPYSFVRQETATT